MPIWLRKFTFKKIQQYFDEQVEAQKKSNSNIDISNPNKSNIPKPPISAPTYVSKGNKK